MKYIKPLLNKRDAVAFALSIALLAFLVIGTTVEVVQFTNQYDIKLQNFINIEPKTTLAIEKSTK